MISQHNNITTVQFDFDGTLVNTIPLIVYAFQQTLDYFLPNQTFSEQAIYDYIGPSLVDTFDSLLPEKRDEMIQYYRKISDQYFIHDEKIST